jgi:hypothetical protein
LDAPALFIEIKQNDALGPNRKEELKRHVLKKVRQEGTA